MLEKAQLHLKKGEDEQAIQEAITIIKSKESTQAELAEAIEILHAATSNLANQNPSSIPIISNAPSTTEQTENILNSQLITNTTNIQPASSTPAKKLALSDFILPKEDLKTPYLKALLIFILSTGYQVTDEDTNNFPATLEQDFCKKVLTLIQSASILAKSTTFQDQVLIHDLLAQWIPDYPKTSLTHLIIEKSDPKTLTAAVLKFPDLIPNIETYVQLYKQPKNSKPENLKKLFTHLVNILDTNDIKTLYQQTTLLRHCAECNTGPLINYLFKLELLSATDLEECDQNNISPLLVLCAAEKQHTLLNILTTNPILCKKITSDTWLQTTTQNETPFACLYNDSLGKQILLNVINTISDTESSLLYTLCLEKRPYLFQISKDNPNFLKKISTTAWSANITQGKHLGASPLLWLCTSDLGNQILLQLFKINPKLQKDIPASAWSTPITQGEYTGVSPLYSLCESEERKKTLLQLIEKNPKLFKDLPVEAFYGPKAQGENAGASPLFWLCGSPLGRKILLKLFEINPKLQKNIPTSAWSSPITEGEYAGASPLNYLCNSTQEQEIQILLQLKDIPVEAWYRSKVQGKDAGSSPLLRLCVSSVGRKTLLKLFEINPKLQKDIPAAAWTAPLTEGKFTGMSPLYLLCSFEEGKPILLQLIEKNPKLFEDIPVETWYHSKVQGENTGIPPLFWICGSSSGREVLLKLFETNLKLQQDIPASAWVTPITQGKYAGQSPLHSLCKDSKKGVKILLKLLENNPNLYKEIPTAFAPVLKQIGKKITQEGTQKLETKQYQEAINDFNHAIKLGFKTTDVYESLAEAQDLLAEAKKMVQSEATINDTDEQAVKKSSKGMLADFFKEITNDLTEEIIKNMPNSFFEEKILDFASETFKNFYTDTINQISSSRLDEKCSTLNENIFSTYKFENNKIIEVANNQNKIDEWKIKSWWETFRINDHAKRIDTFTVLALQQKYEPLIKIAAKELKDDPFKILKDPENCYLSVKTLLTLIHFYKQEIAQLKFESKQYNNDLFIREKIFQRFFTNYNSLFLKEQKAQEADNQQETQENDYGFYSIGSEYHTLEEKLSFYQEKFSSIKEMKVKLEPQEKKLDSFENQLKKNEKTEKTEESLAQTNFFKETPNPQMSDSNAYQSNNNAALPIFSPESDNSKETNVKTDEPLASTEFFKEKPHNPQMNDSDASQSNNNAASPTFSPESDNSKETDIKTDESLASTEFFKEKPHNPQTNDSDASQSNNNAASITFSPESDNLKETDVKTDEPLAQTDVFKEISNQSNNDTAPPTFSSELDNSNETDVKTDESLAPTEFFKEKSHHPQTNDSDASQSNNNAASITFSPESDNSKETDVKADASLAPTKFFKEKSHHPQTNDSDASQSNNNAALPIFSSELDNSNEIDVKTDASLAPTKFFKEKPHNPQTNDSDASQSNNNTAPQSSGPN